MLAGFIRKTLARISRGRPSQGAVRLRHAAVRPRHPGQGDVVPGLCLYQYRACPYCMIVRRAIERLGLRVELRDIRRNPHDREELISCGGRQMVPCLRIEEGDEVLWMYESRDIIRYLQARFEPRESPLIGTRMD